MKISLEWLSTFVDFTETDPFVIADRLTKSMGEIDQVDAQGAFLKNCVVGKVVSVERHPNADKLSIAMVETEQGKKRVVCGGTNVKENMLVAFAHLGATVKWHGGETMTLERVKIRGEESEGMICAAEELDLGAGFAPSKEDGERPIVDLTARKLKVGMPLREALEMNDVVFHVDNHAITNRPDLFSHIGVARECVALGLAKWKTIKKAKAQTFPKTASPFRTELDAAKLIPRYLACTLTIDPSKKTPEWMVKRLEAAGSRSINLAVDITNYVMFEMGMPLHSFDTDDLHGNIVIRTSKKDERITTLDGIDRKLTEGLIVMSDDKGIFDLLGVMGGLRSSTKDTTTSIYLHSAVVDGPTVRKAITATAHRTDAATIYEKGVMPITAEEGFYCALQLFIELAGAKITSKLETHGTNGTPKKIKISEKKIASYLGMKLSKREITDILKNLGCTIAGSGDALTVTTPLWRRDLESMADIAEEIGRIKGYNDIPAVAPEALVTPPARDPRLHQVRGALKDASYIELLHLAFMSPELVKKTGMRADQTVQVQNPLGEELSLMRPSLLPHVLASLRKALVESNGDIAVFEYGHVFGAQGNEHAEFAAVRSTRSEEITAEPALRLKADLSAAFHTAGYELEIDQSSGKENWMHPGRTASLLIGKTVVGTLFEIHPSILAAFDLPKTAAAIIDWEKVLAIEPAAHIFQAIGTYPAVSYDETFTLPKEALKAVINRMKKADPLLTGIETVDLYRKADVTNVTLRFTYRAADRTLNEQDAKSAHARVMSALS